MSHQKETSIKQEGQLKRNLTLFEATIYSISYVIGTGIFLKPSSVLMNTGSTGISILLWIAGGLISMCSALTIAEIAAHIPKLGGMYTYIKELYGDLPGFIFGWMGMVITAPASAAASAIAFATFASYFVQFSDLGLKILALSMVLLFAIIQMISTKASIKLQVAGTIGKLVPIFLIILFGLFKGKIPGVINFSLVGGSPKGAFGIALLGVLWAYDGWQTTCQLGSEIINPERNLPKAIIFSLTLVTAIYAIFNVVIFKVVPTEQVLAGGSSSVGQQAAQVLFGNVGASLVSIGMLISSATTLNAQIIYSARMTLSVAKSKQTIGAGFLGKVNAKYDTPINSLIFVVIMVIIYILTGTFSSVTNLAMFIVWVFFIITILGIFKLRNTYERNNELYHVPLFPIVPILGAIGGGYILISTLMSNPIPALIGTGVALIGLPMYYYCKKKYGSSN